MKTWVKEKLKAKLTQKVRERFESLCACSIGSLLGGRTSKMICIIIKEQNRVSTLIFLLWIQAFGVIISIFLCNSYVLINKSKPFFSYFVVVAERNGILISLEVCMTSIILMCVSEWLQKFDASFFFFSVFIFCCPSSIVF